MKEAKQNSWQISGKHNIKLFTVFLLSVPSQMLKFLVAPGGRPCSSSGGMPRDKSWVQLDVTKAGDTGQLGTLGNKSSSKGRGFIGSFCLHWPENPHRAGSQGGPRLRS